MPGTLTLCTVDIIDWRPILWASNNLLPLDSLAGCPGAWGRVCFVVRCWCNLTAHWSLPCQLIYGLFFRAASPLIGPDVPHGKIHFTFVWAVLVNFVFLCLGKSVSLNSRHLPLRTTLSHLQLICGIIYHRGLNYYRKSILIIFKTSRIKLYCRRSELFLQIYNDFADWITTGNRFAKSCFQFWKLSLVKWLHLWQDVHGSKII